MRLRKMVAFHRFLARLLATNPDVWVLKDGLALQVRLGSRSRVTKDIDMLFTDDTMDVHALLTRAMGADLGDWFTFAIGLNQPGEVGQGETTRFPISSQLDGRTFETFHLDVGTGDPVIEPTDWLAMPPVLAFADVATIIVPCYPISQQIAEKLHAYSRPHGAHVNTRVKDLVDIVLLAGLERIHAAALRRAIEATFESSASCTVPPSLPEPPGDWAPPYRRLAGEVGLVQTSLADGFAKARRFLDPVLAEDPVGWWNPGLWQWESEDEL